MDLYWEQQSYITVFGCKGILPLNCPTLPYSFQFFYLLNFRKVRIDRAWELENKSFKQTVPLLPLQFCRPLFHFLMILANKRSCWIVTVHDLNEGFYWTDVSGEYPKPIMMSWIQADTKTNNRLIHITMREKVRDANILKMPLIFWNNKFSFLKARTVYVHRARKSS